MNFFYFIPKNGGGGALKKTNDAQIPEPHVLTPGQRVYLVFKYLVDFVLSAVGLAVLLIPMAVLAVAIMVDDPGPALFTQKRVGKDRKFFSLYKFRTMRADTPHDMPTHLLADPQQYITRVGKVMRRFSLDELPQLLNILLGQMSIVGPRPALWNQFDLVEEREKYGAHQVRPGLTGWAQINGRDELPIPVKAALDGEYIRNLGAKMDLKCFFGTFGIWVSGKGIVEGGTGELERDQQE